MAERTYFILQEFEFAKKRWRPKAAREVASRDIALRAAERIKARNLPVLAFSRKGDPDTGDFDDAEVIAAFNVPSEFMGEGADL